MSPLAWLLFVALAAALAAGVALLYRRREPPGRGRPLLTALRAAALAVLLLLVFDPELPAGGRVGGGPSTRVLLDASLSMRLSSRWDDAVTEARRLAGREEVVLFGDVPRLVIPDSLDDLAPEAASTRLLPALQAAAEAGARRVVVVTDGGVEDATSIARWLPTLGISLDEQLVGGDAHNLAVAEIDAPTWAQAGEPLDLRVGIASVGSPPSDSVRVSIRSGTETLAEARVAPPAAGRLSTASLRFTPVAPDGGGHVRYEVVIDSGDPAPDDDTRTIYIFVTERPTGVAIVSFQPDWEPRFLLPVLERALGIPARGFLRAAGGRWVQAGQGSTAGELLTGDDVRDAVALADLVVFHGLTAGTPLPDWAAATLRSAPRLIVLPGSDATGLPLPIELGRATAGEWTVAPDLPPSPVAPLIAAEPLVSAPPLVALHTVEAPPGVWAPLLARRGRSGTGQPLALAGEARGRRWAVALGVGYWRWAFRNGETADAYARLWSALAGWVVREQGTVAAEPVRPVQRAVPRGVAPAWIAPGLGADSVQLTLTDAGGNARDTVLMAAADTVRAAVLPPGRYRYRATALDGDTIRASAEGEITVETWSPDFVRPAVALEEVEASARPVGRAGAGPTRPLHATPWPYALILILLAAEWILRRRWGLR